MPTVRIPSPSIPFQEQKGSQQAEGSSHNPHAQGLRMRTLIELQVISYLLAQQSGNVEDLAQLRADFAVSQNNED